MHAKIQNLSKKAYQNHKCWQWILKIYSAIVLIAIICLGYFRQTIVDVPSVWHMVNIAIIVTVILTVPIICIRILLYNWSIKLTHDRVMHEKLGECYYSHENSENKHNWYKNDAQDLLPDTKPLKIDKKAIKAGIDRTYLPMIKQPKPLYNEQLETAHNSSVSYFAILLLDQLLLLLGLGFFSRYVNNTSHQWADLMFIGILGLECLLIILINKSPITIIVVFGYFDVPSDQSEEYMDLLTHAYKQIEGISTTDTANNNSDNNIDNDSDDDSDNESDNDIDNDSDDDDDIIAKGEDDDA